MLCDECEQLLARRYETPSSDDWKRISGRYSDGPRILPATAYQPTEAAGATTVTGLDYHSMKLFLLTQLWRSAEASIREFSAVKVPRPHRRRLRRMLLDGDAGDIEAYPCSVYLLPDAPDLLSAPIPRGRPPFAFVFFVPGVALFYHLSHRVVDQSTLVATLTKEGRLHPIMMSAQRIPEYRIAVDLGRAVEVPEAWLEG